MINTKNNNLKVIFKFLIIFFVLATTSFTSIADNKTLEFEVSRGDNFYKFFSKAGLEATLLNKIMKNDLAKRLNSIRPGDKVEITINNKELKKIVFKPLNSNALLIIHDQNKFNFINIDTSPKKELQETLITITKSLNYDGKRAGINRQILDLIIKNFAWEINFNKDVQKGDKFIIFWDNKKNPKAIIYMGAHKTISLFARQTKENGTQFYNINGKTINDSFNFAPLDYIKISSSFSRSRYHPILKTYRPHRGTDFAAPENTPIYAPAKGRVKHIAVVRGYGNVVYLAHGSNIVTVYAHLSKFAKGLKVDKKIKKGQLIGYVGSTGLATGPHLHYEIRINGVHQDPEKIKLAKQLTIAENELLDFHNNHQYILSKLQIQ